MPPDRRAPTLLQRCIDAEDQAIGEPYRTAHAIRMLDSSTAASPRCGDVAGRLPLAKAIADGLRAPALFLRRQDIVDDRRHGDSSARAESHHHELCSWHRQRGWRVMLDACVQAARDELGREHCIKIMGSGGVACRPVDLVELSQGRDRVIVDGRSADLGAATASAIRRRRIRRSVDRARHADDDDTARFVAERAPTSCRRWSSSSRWSECKGLGFPVSQEKASTRTSRPWAWTRCAGGASRSVSAPTARLDHVQECREFTIRSEVFTARNSAAATSIRGDGGPQGKLGCIAPGARRPVWSETRCRTSRCSRRMARTCARSSGAVRS